MIPSAIERLKSWRISSEKKTDGRQKVLSGLSSAGELIWQQKRAVIGQRIARERGNGLVNGVGGHRHQQHRASRKNIMARHRGHRVICFLRIIITRIIAARAYRGSVHRGQIGHVGVFSLVGEGGVVRQIC